MTNPPDYASGLGETVRAYRLYMGLKQRTLAERLEMSQRSLERIENNQRACPPGFITSLDDLTSTFDNEVEALGGKPLDMPAGADEWTRAVYRRAAVESGRTLRS